ncbi:QWRF motif-containing protein 2-like [Amaranthus tricolor]|uniref:QWRF motif-containing protein 2-like n=1 Tax=Amaranthus tricolor TaxID=29722 RepID=UPI002590E0E1|nr:QWRF motif-containing protein 2-like [Amaranthus tricolor]
MVVATSTTPNNLKNLRSQSNPKRPPLLPSEGDISNKNKSNDGSITGFDRRPKSREVSSRYLSISSSSSTSGSSSSTFSNSSYFSPSSRRRCPSPLPSRINTTAPATPATNPSRLQSDAAKLLISSSKSMSVSFQGTAKKSTKPLPSPVASVRRAATPTPDRKQNLLRPSGGNARLVEQQQQQQHLHPWPGRSRPPVSSLTRSVDLGGLEGKKLINGSTTKVVRDLRESLIGNCKLNTSMCKDDKVKVIGDDNASCFNGGSSLGSESAVSDRESVSSECNSGSQDSNSNASVRRSKGGARNIVVTAKLWHEANSSRSKRVPDPGSPVARSNLLKGSVPPKLIPSKALVTGSPGASPRRAVSNRGFSSSLPGSLRPSSPGHIRTSLHSTSKGSLGTSLQPASPAKLVSSLPPASPAKSGASLRPASPSKLGASLRPASSSNSGAFLRPASPAESGASLRPASPAKSGASLRPASPAKSGASLRPASPAKSGASLRPASPAKSGTSLRPASPAKPGASLRPASPAKLGASLRPASPAISGASLRCASPGKLGTSFRPASPGKPGASLQPAAPGKPGASLRPSTPGKPGASLRSASPSKVGSSLRPASPSKVGSSLRPQSPGILGTSLRPASPNKLGTSLASENISCSGMGRMASPSRVRQAIAASSANAMNSMPSVLCFGADVRRVRVSDSRLGDAHLLRILHNRQLQWRFVNARVESSFSIQKFNAERSLYNAWKATSDLRDTVSSKRKELQWLKQNMKLVSILKGEMLYLEEWALMVTEHCSSLYGAIESFKASTICLPLIGGAKADIHDVKDAICSAADVMHAMASSICCLLEKVEEVNSLATEVASVTLKEQAFLNECKDILSMLVAMQVKDCSLRAHMLQLKGAPSILAIEV